MSRKDSSKVAKKILSQIKSPDRWSVWTGEKDLIDLGLSCDKALRRAVYCLIDSWINARVSFAEDGALVVTE